MKEQIEKTEAEWREQLTDQQYHVTREAGTEAPFAGQYHDTKATAWYAPSCCAAAATPTSATCSRMARNLLACDTASTPHRWTWTKKSNPTSLDYP